LNFQVAQLESATNCGDTPWSFSIIKAVGGGFTIFLAIRKVDFVHSFNIVT